jgi:hypothetical protein
MKFLGTFDALRGFKKSAKSESRSDDAGRGECRDCQLRCRSSSCERCVGGQNFDEVSSELLAFLLIPPLRLNVGG